VPGTVIAFEGVSRDFVGEDGRTVHAVRDVSLDVREGETLCLIGTSGSGKTTLLKLVNRLLEPTAGRVLVQGRDVRELDVVALRRGLGWVIQSGGLFPHMTVARNVGLLCELEGWERPRVQQRVDELLDLVHLPPGEFSARRPSELSGGQRQRVGVARALALDPPIVLMDEPFGALDPITRTQLRAEFAELRARVGKTVVFVTHDMTEAFEVGDRVALLDGGRLVQVGTEREFREQPADEFVTEFLRVHFDGAAGRV
jgi:osmoprotectant transport system ATP-binding protein